LSPSGGETLRAAKVRQSAEDAVTTLRLLFFDHRLASRITRFGLLTSVVRRFACSLRKVHNVHGLP
jgi:hypothetical protein